MSKVNKNIETLNTIEIDSLKLRIPYDQIEVVNSLLIDKIGVYNVETGEELEEPKPRNWYRIEKQNDFGKKLYSYKWSIERITTEKGRATKYICVQLNSKLLHQHYFKGISLHTIKLAYKQLMNEKVVSFSLDTFLNAYVTDIDFKKDVLHYNFLQAITTLNELSKPYKQYGKGANPFRDKGNMGIEWSNRRTASPGNPFLKLYHKGIQCLNHNDMIPFYETYLKGGSDVVRDRVRIEFTVKNKGHLKKLLKDDFIDNKLIEVLKLSQEQKNDMLLQYNKHHLLPRKISDEKPKTDLKPSDMAYYMLMSGWSDDSLRTKDAIINHTTKHIHPKQRRSEMKKKLEHIWDTYIQMRTKAKENEDLNHLFSALCWH